MAWIIPAAIAGAAYADEQYNQGDARKKLMKGDVMGSAKSLTDLGTRSVFGGGNDPGLLGGGHRKVNEQTANTQAGNVANYDRWQQMFGQGAADAGARQGFQIDPAQQAQMREKQLGLISALEAQARGEGPSLAQGQLRQATDRNMAQAMALGASQRGPGQAGALRNIATQQAAAGQQAAADSAMIRAQEQLAAQNQLGQVLAGARGMDIGLATEQARLDTTNRGMNDQAVQYYLSQGVGLDEANRKAAMDMERMRLESALGYEGLRNQAYGDAGGRRLQLTKMGMDAAAGGASAAGQGISTLASSGALAAMSDERVKTDIAPADAKLDGFLEALGAHEYSYKDEKHGKGRRISPMAQEMERSELGREFVFETEDGKAVDYGKMAGTLLAGEARLAKRIKKLEEALGA